MAEEINVRSYKLGDEEAIVQLLQEELDGWKRLRNALEYWKWKYLDNPNKVISIVIATSGDKIIGFNHGCPFKIKIGDGTFLGVLSGAVLISKNFRGKGAYLKILELHDKQRITQGITCCYWYSVNPIIKKIDRNHSRGFPFPKTILELVRIRNIDLHLKNRKIKKGRFNKYTYRLVKYVNIFKTFIIKLKYNKIYNNINILEVDKFDERINEFWINVKNHYNFILERNLEYLNWRYCDKRGGNYIVKQAESNGEVIGYMVLETSDIDGYQMGFITDLLTLPERPDAADALIKNACQYYDGKNVNVIHYWVMKNHPYERIFNKHGFLNNRTKPYIAFRNISVGKEIESLIKSSPKELHFQYSDIEAV